MTKEMSSIVRKAIKILREEGVKVFFRRAFSYFILPYVLIRIKSLNKKAHLSDLVNFCFYNTGGLVKPAQVRDEILEMLRILDEIRPKVVIEIGTARGATLFLFSRVASEDATIISIDLPSGKFGGGYLRWKIPLYKSFRLPRQKLHLIRADSHSQETLEKVKLILSGREVDFLFIDGDHTYEGVKRDFEMYNPLVKEEGIIAFHDIVVHPLETGCEVSKFWSEIKERYDYVEIIKDQNQNWAGIGLLFTKQKNKDINN